MRVRLGIKPVGGVHQMLQMVEVDGTTKQGRKIKGTHGHILLMKPRDHSGPAAMAGPGLYAPRKPGSKRPDPQQTSAVAAETVRQILTRKEVDGTYELASTAPGLFCRNLVVLYHLI